MTTGNSSPFALCSVINQIRASREPSSSSASDNSDNRSTNEPSEVFDAPLGVLGALLTQISQIPALIQDFADCDRDRLLAGDSGQADDQVAENGQRRGGACGKGALFEAPDDARPERAGREG